MMFREAFFEWAVVPKDRCVDLGIEDPADLLRLPGDRASHVVLPICKRQVPHPKFPGNESSLGFAPPGSVLQQPSLL